MIVDTHGERHPLECPFKATSELARIKPYQDRVGPGIFCADRRHWQVQEDLMAPLARKVCEAVEIVGVG